MSLFASLFGNNSSSSSSRTSLEGPVRDATLNLVNRATAYADQPYVAYPHPRIAEFTPDQLSAFESARQIATNAGGLFGNFLADASSRIANERTYWDPLSQSAANLATSLAASGAGRIPISDYFANRTGGLGNLGEDILYEGMTRTAPLRSLFPDAPISAYMNPYVDAVLSPAIDDLMRRADNTRLDITDRSIRTGSFGGSRNAIAQGLHEKSVLEELGRLSANERARAFNEAANQWRLDQQRLPEAYSTLLGQTGTAQGLHRQGQTANTQTIQDRNLVTQGNLSAQQAIQNILNLRAARHSAYGDLFEANRGLLGTMVNPLLATGGMQQEHAQDHLTRMYEDFLEQRDWDRRGIDMLIRALSLAIPSNQTTVTEQRGPRPNAIGQVLGTVTGLAGLLGGGGGLFGAIKNIGGWLGFKRGGLVGV